MLNWHSWSGTPEEWDHSLICSEDYTVFQSFGWGEYKKESGWIPERYNCLDENSKTQGMAQILIRKLPFCMTFVWISGGPVFRFSDFNVDKIAKLTHNLIDEVRAKYPRSLIRFYSQMETYPDLSYSLNKVCLRPYVKLNSGFSVQFKLNQSIAKIRQNMTSKHRYYTKIASASQLSWLLCNDDSQLARLATIHQEMVNEKKLDYISTSLDKIHSMRDHLGDKVQILTGFLNEDPVTTCLVLLFGSKAFYMVASTGKKGRKISASYAMFERLIQELADRGITDFDFGGIDPASKAAAGVNHFKCGFGGKLVEYLGEWESASSGKVRIAINLAIRLKGYHL